MRRRSSPEPRDRSLNVSQRFGRNLARHRRNADLSQELLGEKAGLHRTAISQLEQGERVCRIDTLAKLCAALEIDVGALMQGVKWVPSQGSTAGRFENEPHSEFEDDLIERDAR